MRWIKPSPFSPGRAHGQWGQRPLFLERLATASQYQQQEGDFEWQKCTFNVHACASVHIRYLFDDKMNIAHMPSEYGGCLVKPPPPPPTAKCAVGAYRTLCQNSTQCCVINMVGRTRKLPKKKAEAPRCPRLASGECAWRKLGRARWATLLGHSTCTAQGSAGCGHLRASLHLRTL